MFKLNFTTDNAVFEDDPQTEIARILRNVCEKLEQGLDDTNIHDLNGNVIGGWRFEDEDRS